jgi:predicted DNA-binding transcriptional regulator YafY
MSTMKQLARLKQIYMMLSHSPQTIESIQIALQELGTAVSNRQIYRDLVDVGQYFLRGKEKLEQKNQEYNRKVYCIISDNDGETINNYDIDSYLLTKLVMPVGIERGRSQSMLKFRTIFAKHLSGSKIEQNSNWNGISMMNTHFNEIPFDQDFQSRLDQILWSVSNHRAIEITSYTGDSVSIYRSVKFPFVFQPMKLLYHRGGFFVAGLIESDKRCLVLDIYQINAYKLSNTTFPFKKELPMIEKNLQDRFGITQNISQMVYDVILEFSSTTGKYIEAHIWHHSQRYEVLPDGNLRVHFKCGINRELLGWIYMWMGNVKILEPQILKDYFCEQIKLIHKAYDAKHLDYNNISQPD